MRAARRQRAVALLNCAHGRHAQRVRSSMHRCRTSVPVIRAVAVQQASVPLLPMEHDDSSAPEMRVRRLVGVYDADGTLRGEVAYVVGKLLGRAHCGLCDITHGALGERASWKACRAALPVPFETYHRDDQPDTAKPLTADRLPAVLAETDTGLVYLLGPVELDACDASPTRLVEAVNAALSRCGLSVS